MCLFVLDLKLFGSYSVVPSILLLIVMHKYLFKLLFCAILNLEIHQENPYSMHSAKYVG